MRLALEQNVQEGRRSSLFLLQWFENNITIGINGVRVESGSVCVCVWKYQKKQLDVLKSYVDRGEEQTDLKIRYPTTYLVPGQNNTQRQHTFMKFIICEKWNKIVRWSIPNTTSFQKIQKASSKSGHLPTKKPRGTMRNNRQHPYSLCDHTHDLGQSN